MQFTAWDITGLVLAGTMYGAPYDVLASALDVKAARLHGITCRWRQAGLAQTGRIGPGPAWCWLTSAGMRAVGLQFPARRPPFARLAHIRAVLAARLSSEASEEFTAGFGMVAQRAPTAPSGQASPRLARAPARPGTLI